MFRTHQTPTVTTGWWPTLHTAEEQTRAPRRTPPAPPSAHVSTHAHTVDVCRTTEVLHGWAPQQIGVRQGTKGLGADTSQQPQGGPLPSPLSPDRLPQVVCWDCASAGCPAVGRSFLVRTAGRMIVPTCASSRRESSQVNDEPAGFV